MASHKTYYLDPSYWRFNDTATDTTAYTSAVVDGKFNNTVLSSAGQVDGKILIGGTFTYDGNASRILLIRTNSNGTLDSDFMTNAVDSKFATGTNVYAITVQPDGKILVGGFYTYTGASGRRSLIRLNSDGTTDESFCNNATDFNKFTGTVRSIVLQSDGKILVGGTFTNYAGLSTRRGLIRLYPDGTLDTAFCANASDANQFANFVYSVSVQTDGKILVGGDFSGTVSGVTTKNLVRLNSDGTLDTTFTQALTTFLNPIFSVKAAPNGKIFVGGGFTNYGTSGRNNFIRLNSDGSIDTAFCANSSDGSKFGSQVQSIFLQTDGKILVGGAFLNYGGTSLRNRLIRLNSDGTLDTTFCTNYVDNSKFTNIVGNVNQFDEKLLIGGSFIDYGGAIGRSYFVSIPRDFGGGSLKTEGVFKDPTGAFVLNPNTLAALELTKTATLTKYQIDAHNRSCQPTTLTIPNASDFTVANWTTKGWGSSIPEILVNYNQFITANFATTAITLQVNPANYTQSTLLVSGTIGGTSYFVPICYFGETGSTAQVVGSVSLSPNPASTIPAGSLFLGSTTVLDQSSVALEGITTAVKISGGATLGTNLTAANGSVDILCTAPDTAATYTILAETQTSTPVQSSTQSYIVSTGATLKTGTEAFASTSGLTQIVSTSFDDANVLSGTIPFSWYFFGSNYASSVYVGSNTYLTFGFGSSAYYNITPSNPGRGIYVGVADNSYQRVYYGTLTVSGRSVYVIRYEGTATTSGTPGSPNIVIQYTFFEGQKMNVNVGVHNRLGGVVGISDGTNYNYSGTWTLAQNTTYALRSDPNGNNWTVYPGQYFGY